MERIHDVHRVAREVRRKRFRHGMHTGPLRGRAVAREDDVHLRPLREHREQLVLEVSHQGRLARFRHARVTDRVQTTSVGVEEVQRSYGGFVPGATVGAVGLRGWKFLRRPVPPLVPWRLWLLGLAPPRFRVLRDSRISYQLKKSSRRASRCRIVTPVECIALTAGLGDPRPCPSWAATLNYLPRSAESVLDRRFRSCYR